MAGSTVTYTVRIHLDSDGMWAEVLELPGCFATGDTLDELWEVLEEGISLYLSTDEKPVQVALVDDDGEDVVEEQRQFEVCPQPA